MSPWILTCPSSRGIGFAMTRHLLRTTRVPIIATARDQPEGVKRRLLDGMAPDDEERLEVLRVDITDEDSIRAAAAHCSRRFPLSTKNTNNDDNRLHLAFISPGILLPTRPEKVPHEMDMVALRRSFEVNTIGPMLLFKHFSPFLLPFSTPGSDKVLNPNHPIFAILSARLGSITDDQTGGWYGYRSSKAGLNGAIKAFDIWLAMKNRMKKNNRPMVVGLHPGTVKTDFTRDYWADGKREMLDVDDAVRRLAEVLKDMEAEMGGRCWDWKGLEVPP